MTARVDVAGPIAAVRRRAEREFDLRILELTPVEERPMVVARQEAPGAYQLGVLAAAFQQAAESFARAFAQGQADYRRGSDRG